MAASGPGRRRFLALALLLVPLIAGIALVAVPLRLAERSAADLEAIEAHIARLEQRLVTREQVMADLRQLERTNQLDTRLMEAATPAVAGAALAGTLGEFLQRAGGYMDSTQVLEPVADPPVIRIGVRLRGAIDIGGLRAFLHLVERHEPILTVERIALRGGGQDAGGLMQTELTVIGYARSGEPEAKDGGEDGDRDGDEDQARQSAAAG